MKVLSRLVPAIGVGMLAMTALAAPAFASTGASAGDSGNTGAVFVQTDNTAGNAVAAYHRAADGTLALAGSGEPVEWAVEMRRFDDALTFDNLAHQGRIDPALADALGRIVAAAHARAAPDHGM